MQAPDLWRYAIARVLRPVQHVGTAFVELIGAFTAADTAVGLRRKLGHSRTSSICMLGSPSHSSPFNIQLDDHQACCMAEPVTEPALNPPISHERIWVLSDPALRSSSAAMIGVDQI